MEYYLLLFFLGLVGGFLAGLIGIGGGAVYVLILPYLLIEMGFPQEEIVQYTIANSLVGTFFAALSANVVLYRQGKIYWKMVILIGAFGSVISLLLLRFFVNTPMYSVTEFNLAVIGLMIFIIYRTVKQNWKAGPQKEKELGLTASAVVGGGAGAVSALSGLGGGTIIIPILNLGFQMNMVKAKSISLGVILISSLAASVFNLFEVPNVDYVNQSYGYIVWPLALVISLGVVIGSPLGVKVSNKMSQQSISIIFVVFVFVVIIDKAIQLF